MAFSASILAVKHVAATGATTACMSKFGPVLNGVCLQLMLHYGKRISEFTPAGHIFHKLTLDLGLGHFSPFIRSVTGFKLMY